MKSSSKDTPRIIYRQYDKVIAKDDIIFHSGMIDAYKALTSSIENSSQENVPLCLIGGSGTGKTALLSDTLKNGMLRGLSPKRFNINEMLGYRAREEELSSFFSSLPGLGTVAIEGLESILEPEAREWEADLVYKSIKHAAKANIQQYLSFSGTRREYDAFLGGMEESELKNMLRSSEGVELSYPSEREHWRIIREAVANSRGYPLAPMELEGVIINVENRIGRSQPSVGDIQEYVAGEIISLRKPEEMRPYQADILITEEANTALAFYEALQSKGYDEKVIAGKGRKALESTMRKVIIEELAKRGATDPLEIGRITGINTAIVKRYLKNLKI